jgi:tetrapyrrole methylase family protein/MazG family protein
MKKEKRSPQEHNSDHPSAKDDASTQPPSEGDASKKPPREGDASKKPPRKGDASTQPPGEGDASKKPPRKGDASKKPPREGDASTQPPGEGDASRQPPGEGHVSNEPSAKKRASAGALFEELCRLSSFLRSEEGCPWDRAQTIGTLTPYLLEEACEAIEAVENGDMDRLREELGDLIFLVIFMADIAGSEGRFTSDQVLDGIRTKMFRRHPHIFGPQKDMTADQVKSQWETIKKGEGQNRSILKEYPASLPGLIQAYRIQEKAAAVGFDWEKTEQVVDKVEEELGEVKAALSEAASAGDTPHSKAPNSGENSSSSLELGDLLFAVVNLCRFTGADPERAIRGSVNKFRRRFTYIEEQLEKRGSSPAEATLEEMDDLWNEAKRLGI